MCLRTTVCLLALIASLTYFFGLHQQDENPYQEPSPICDQKAISVTPLAHWIYNLERMCDPWRDSPIAFDTSDDSDPDFVDSIVDSISDAFQFQCVKHIQNHSSYQSFEVTLENQIKICKNSLFIVHPGTNNRDYLKNFLKYRLGGVSFVCLFERVHNLDKYVDFKRIQ